MIKKIYLCDLTHTSGKNIATESIPLNIGLIKSYLLTKVNSCTIELIKYPHELYELLKNAPPPDLIGFSNYTWNFNLNLFFCNIYKEIYPDGITVFGGTNFPFKPDAQLRMLSELENLDFNVFYEGEESFYQLISSLNDRSLKKGAPISGVSYIDRATNKLVIGDSVARITTLDSIPSPYVMGYLDKFFDGKLTPLVETARGCPFKCNFCNAGEAYFDKVNKFSNDYIKQELTYIARMAAQANMGHVTFADNNFGMIPRDINTTNLLVDLQEKYGWPKSITVWTGKNSKKRVIEVTRALGDKLSISMSVQSMDANVLHEVKRDNIKIADYKAITEELNNQGRPQHAEVIMPLPGESKESHINGLKALLDLNVSKVFSHTLQMLWGTPYKDDLDYRKTYGYQTKWRIVPLNFTRFEGCTILDVEEVAISTNTLNFADYIECRIFLFLIDVLYNSKFFDLVIKYLNLHNIKTSEWIEYIYQNRAQLNIEFIEIVNAFQSETRAELWDSEEEIHDYFQTEENYTKLLNYEVGGNVLFKHRVRAISENFSNTVDSVIAISKFMPQLTRNNSNHFLALDNISRYIQATVEGCFDYRKAQIQVTEDFSYDILSWNQDKSSNKIEVYEHNCSYSFSYSKQHLSILEDGNIRYGTDIAGIVKSIQRTAGTIYLRTPTLILKDGVGLPNFTAQQLNTDVNIKHNDVGPGNCST